MCLLFFRIFVHAKLPAWPENAQAGRTCHLWKFCVFFLKDGMCSGSDRGLVVSITTRWTLKVCLLHEIIRISFKKFWMYFLEGIFEMVSLGHFVFQQNHCSNSACHLEPLGFLAAHRRTKALAKAPAGQWCGNRTACHSERTVGFPRIPFNDTGLPWVTYVTWWIDSADILMTADSSFWTFCLGFPSRPVIRPVRGNIHSLHCCSGSSIGGWRISQLRVMAIRIVQHVQHSSCEKDEVGIWKRNSSLWQGIAGRCINDVA